MKRFVGGIIVAAIAAGALHGTGLVFADTYTGTSWKINGSFGQSLGGSGSSTSYTLVETGGESVIGNGSGGSYTMTGGYVARLQNSLQLTIQPSGLAGYWPMEDARGTSAQDVSVNGNNAVLKNTPVWGTGKVSGAVTFVDKSRQYRRPANQCHYRGCLVQNQQYCDRRYDHCENGCVAACVVAEHGWQAGDL